MTVTDSLTRQWATGIAAFFITALLILASAPAERMSSAVRFDGSAAAVQVRTVLTMHG